MMKNYTNKNKNMKFMTKWMLFIFSLWFIMPICGQNKNDNLPIEEDEFITITPITRGEALEKCKEDVLNKGDEDAFDCVWFSVDNYFAYSLIMTNRYNNYNACNHMISDIERLYRIADMKMDSSTFRIYFFYLSRSIDLDIFGNQDISILIDHLKGEKTYCIDNAYERELVQDYFDKRYVLPDSVAGKELFFEYFSNRPKPDIEAWWDLIMQVHRIK